MGLLEQRQRVHEGIERRAEDAAEGEEGQQCEKGNVRMAEPTNQPTNQPTNYLVRLLVG